MTLIEKQIELNRIKDVCAAVIAVMKAKGAN